MDLRKAQVTQSNVYLENLKRIFKDTLNISLQKGWKQKDKENTVLIDKYMIPEILRIQSEGFQNKSEKEIIRYSKHSRKTFYVIESQKKVVGYCIYYLKPMISFRNIKKQSVIYSIAIDKNFREKGFGIKLLKESIEEMKLNRVSSVFLYVSTNNAPAIRLYEKMGFVIIEQIKYVCDQKENCYKMELKLALFIFCLFLPKTLFSIYNNLSVI
jgi:ribosomal-protein-alanine N-acetyltransferase